MDDVLLTLDRAEAIIAALAWIVTVVGAAIHGRRAPRRECGVVGFEGQVMGKYGPIHCCRAAGHHGRHVSGRPV